MIARQGIRRYFDQFEKRVDPRGKIYYWLAGEVMEEGDAELSVPPVDDRLAQQKASNLDQVLSSIRDQYTTDVKAIKENYITVTPLQYNLTADAALNFMDSWLDRHF